MSQHIEIRDCFIKKRQGDTCYGLGEWRRYNTGAWEAVPDLLIRKEIQDISVKRPGIKTTNGIVTSVYELLKAHLHVSDLLFDSNPNILTFADCVLDLQTDTVVPHSASHYTTSKLPFKYDPTATSVPLEQFLKHLPHINFLQEFAWYCLTPETKYELALWLWGPPGGGKSTLIEALCAMLGAKACVLGLAEIDRSQFALAQLPGKTLAVSTEQPAHVKSSNVINALISGELITYERKFHDPVTIRPHVKIIWAMNTLPTINMDGIGMFRRIIPVHIPAVPESDRDPAIKEAIINAGMAMVNWTLAGGRQRLTARGKFAIPTDLIAARDEYKSRNDLTACFVEECCDQGAENKVKSTALYQKYRVWCLDNGYRSVAMRNFTTDLDRLGFINIKPQNISYWKGLELIDDEILGEIEVDNT